jgi:hypothetical protein
VYINRFRVVLEVIILMLAMYLYVPGQTCSVWTLPDEIFLDARNIFLFIYFLGVLACFAWNMFPFMYCM